MTIWKSRETRAARTQAPASRVPLRSLPGQTTGGTGFSSVGPPLPASFVPRPASWPCVPHTPTIQAEPRTTRPSGTRLAECTHRADRPASHATLARVARRLKWPGSCMPAAFVPSRPSRGAGFPCVEHMARSPCKPRASFPGSLARASCVPATLRLAQPRLAHNTLDTGRAAWSTCVWSALPLTRQ